LEEQSTKRNAALQHDSVMIASLAWLTTWVALNTGLSFFNRVLFQQVGFNFPSLLTLIHGLTSFFYYLILIYVRRFCYVLRQIWSHEFVDPIPLSVSGKLSYMPIPSTPMTSPRSHM
jgi:hypothetical protein